jgi:cytochrome c
MPFLSCKHSLALALALVLAPSIARAGANGEDIFHHTCAMCHTVEAGKNRVGPTLAGVVGRPSGTEHGFTYSPTLQSLGITWTDAKLDAFLTSPREFAPGTKMTFGGIKNAEDRAALIGYLKSR